MTPLLDTHCHIDLDRFDQDRDDVIQRARAAGVQQMIMIGFDPDRWESCARLSQHSAGLHLAVGLHPTEAEQYNDEFEAQLKHAAIEHDAVGIGETGLDYHWKADTAAVQKEAFARQIALAKELDLPFVVHQREAQSDALDVLRSAGAPHRGVMHCFTGDTRFLRECLDLGLHIGLGGAVTFRKLKDLHEAVKLAPLDRIVLETDAPFMTPSPHRGERNEPTYLTFIVDRIAELRDASVDEVANTTTDNAKTLFRLPATVGSANDGCVS